MPTKVTDKKLFEERNVDNNFSREVMLGLLRVLNQQISYEQVWEDTSVGRERINVPFLFDFGEAYNSEKFIQDNYIFFGSDCTAAGITKMPGNFDFYPRGVVSLKSIAIDSGSITNRYVMGRFQKRVGSQIKSYISWLYSLPLSMSFGLEVRADTFNTTLKIDSAFREFFYKNKTYYINYHGSRVPCRCGFAEQLALDKGSTYTMGTYDTDRYFKLTMDLNVETYQPVYDPTAEMPADASAR